MTVQELSEVYRQSAERIAPRLRLLRQQERRAEDPETAYRLWRRMVTLESIRRQDLEIAEHLAQYGKGGSKCTRRP